MLSYETCEILAKLINDIEDPSEKPQANSVSRLLMNVKNKIRNIFKRSSEVNGDKFDFKDIQHTVPPFYSGAMIDENHETYICKPELFAMIGCLLAAEKDRLMALPELTNFELGQLVLVHLGMMPVNDIPMEDRCWLRAIIVAHDQEKVAIYIVDLGGVINCQRQRIKLREMDVPDLRLEKLRPACILIDKDTDADYAFDVADFTNMSAFWLAGLDEPVEPMTLMSILQTKNVTL